MNKHILIPILMVFAIVLTNCEKENPLPVLSSISPTSKVAHLPSFTLTLNGSSFVQGAKVIFNGKQKAATFVSESQLTCEIAPEDIIETMAISGNGEVIPEALADRIVQVLVNNPEPGGGNSAPLNFTIKSNHTFNTPTPIADLSQYTYSGDIKVDKNGVIYVLYRDMTYDYYLQFIKSTDGGTTWTTPITIAYEKYGNLIYWPVMEIDNNGNVHILWIENDGKYVFIGYQYLNTSTNTWSTVTKLCLSNANTYYIESADIAVKDKDVFIITNFYNRNTYKFKTVLNYSSDLGVSFVEKQLTFIGDNGGRYPDIAMLNNGIVLLAYYEYNASDNSDEIYFTKSLDKAATWTAPVKISPSYDTGWSLVVNILPDSSVQNISAIWTHNFTTGLSQTAIKGNLSEDIEPILNRPLKRGNIFEDMEPISNRANMSLAPENIYNLQDDKEVLYFSRSTDGGSTWSAPSIINNYTYFNANIVLSFKSSSDSAGNLNLIFFDYDTSNVRHGYFMRSVNNGATWSSPQELGSNALGITAWTISENTSGDIFSLLNYRTSSSPVKWTVHFCKSTE